MGLWMVREEHIVRKQLAPQHDCLIDRWSKRRYADLESKVVFVIAELANASGAWCHWPADVGVFLERHVLAVRQR